MHFDSRYLYFYMAFWCTEKASFTAYENDYAKIIFLMTWLIPILF